MDLNVPAISLIALLIAIVVSVTTSLNIGTLAIGLSLVAGYYFGGVKIAEIVKGFPITLFIMLAGVTYLFAIAQTNGTLEKISKYAIKAVRGNIALLPIVLFFLAFGLSSMGPGQITISALLAAPAMLLAEQVGISPLLMALVVGNGAQAGAMSPIAPPGIISAAILGKMGITGVSGILWLNMLIAHVAVSILAYFLFGGLKLLRSKDSVQRETLRNVQVEPFTWQQLATIAGIGVLIIGAVFFKLDIGFAAFMIGAILALIKAVDEGQAIKAMPWGTIMMVTGVTVLVQLMSTVGGMDLFASIMAKVSTPHTVTAVAGFVRGLYEGEDGAYHESREADVQLEKHSPDYQHPDTCDHPQLLPGKGLPPARIFLRVSRCTPFFDRRSFRPPKRKYCKADTATWAMSVLSQQNVPLTPVMPIAPRIARASDCRRRDGRHGARLCAVAHDERHEERRDTHFFFPLNLSTPRSAEMVISPGTIDERPKSKKEKHYRQGHDVYTYSLDHIFKDVLQRAVCLGYGKQVVTPGKHDEESYGKTLDDFPQFSPRQNSTQRQGRRFPMAEVADVK